jgi:hypothetical protein
LPRPSLPRTASHSRPRTVRQACLTNIVKRGLSKRGAGASGTSRSRSRFGRGGSNRRVKRSADPTGLRPARPAGICSRGCALGVDAPRTQHWDRIGTRSGRAPAQLCHF